MSNVMPELMTIREFCDRYSVSRTTLYREIAAGRLARRKLGASSRIALSDAQAWAEGLPVLTGEGA